MGSVAENMNEAMDEENSSKKSLVDAMIDENLPGLIEKIPSELRPLAKVFMPVLVRMSVDEIKSLVNGYEIEPMDEYKRLYARLDTQQAIDAGETLKEYWQSLNVANANAATEQAKAVEDLIVVGLLMVKLSMA